jgi:hypothetical protein
VRKKKVRKNEKSSKEVKSEKEREYVCVWGGEIKVTKRKKEKER